ncbi:uncharacterized protein BX663DRAFT_509246 [Cokeromyces recurvatus]|uniref:uncharacterized protein n=1 Tax=Cokeromyces recurvatus TaxID=90255 RepID=UPI00221E6369|nr:uncharacterized protein BX663DRAFT_509246 [Cokeromyces recurvatus]KAI7903016.1 hypothetical protein BX663DRAFT_509246 [Cokeromyces recurvatus]
MLKNCCFCINLRTATLVLAVLGAITHLYGAMTLTALSDEFEEADTGALFGLTAYSYFSGFACLAGAIGVLKKNIKHLCLFNTYYWADLALHTIFSIASAYLLFSLHSELCKELVSEAQDVEFDMSTCEYVYIRGAWFVTIAMAVNMLLKLHFAFAIHSYMKQVKKEIEEEQTTEVIVINKPVYDKQPVMYVAGQEYVPNEKK